MTGYFEKTLKLLIIHALINAICIYKLKVKNKEERYSRCEVKTVKSSLPLNFVTSGFKTEAIVNNNGFSYPGIRTNVVWVETPQLWLLGAAFLLITHLH